MPKALPVENIESTIHLVRGLRVMLDADLARFYGVETKVLNQAVRRNIHRFPEDFAFPLKNKEVTNLRSQIVTSSSGHGGYLPLAFTEHGAVMAANVLNSARAIKMSIFVVRAFVRMRETFAANQQLLSKLSELEERIESHDAGIHDLFDIIRQLTAPLPAKHNRIGFALPDGAVKSRRKLHRLIFPAAR
jgi:hypothetical protein